MTEVLLSIWNVYLDTAFWLLIGLFAAGLVKTYLSEGLMARWLGGHGFVSVLKAALIGAPLPLCSCGVLPAATALRRAGASKPATVSFLISTPETGVDSISVSYALLGPFMAVVRPLAAVMTALFTGLLAALIVKSDDQSESTVTECNSCADTDNPLLEQKESRLIDGMVYAFTRLLDDLSKWLIVGIVVAGIMLHFISPGQLAQWTGGISALLIMMVVGIPMYICAVASTPVAAALLVAGVSPGAVLVFMLVGPATNIASIGIVKNELGKSILVIYLFGITFCSLIFGILLNWAVEYFNLNIQTQMGHAHIIPEWLSIGSAFILLALMVKPLRLLFFSR